MTKLQVYLGPLKQETLFPFTYATHGYGNATLYGFILTEATYKANLQLLGGYTEPFSFPTYNNKHLSSVYRDFFLNCI